MRYTVDERHDQIVELVMASGSIKVNDLADQLGISAVTVRRDVEALATSGRLRRVRGAVMWPGGTGEPSQPATPPVIGLVVPHDTRYFGDIIRGAQEAVAVRSGRLVLGITHYDRSRDIEQAQRLAESGVDGLLMVPSWLTGESDSDEGFSFEVPTVLVERRMAPGTRASELDWVCTDHATGAALAVRHLASLGHERIALVAGLSPTQYRATEGYEAALRTLGLPPAPSIHMRNGDAPPDDVDKAAKALVKAVRKGDTTAALVISEVDALMMLPILRQQGVRVPEDLAIVAYDDDFAGLSDLPLTAVQLPKHAVGFNAARVLLDRIMAQPGDYAPPQHLDLVPRLQLRESCGRLLRK